MVLSRIDEIELYTTQGLCLIELLYGDITTMTHRDKVDFLLVSTVSRYFSIKHEPLIKSLWTNFQVKVDELSQDMECDLRKDYQCWLSKPMTSDLPFKRIICFEKQTDIKNPEGLLRNIFRSLTPIFGNKDKTLACNLLGTWYQDFNHIEVLNMTINAACNWMKIGLPLRKLKIILCPKDLKENRNDLEACASEFARLKAKWTVSKSLRFSQQYDVYLSYSEADEKKADALVTCLKQVNENLRIYHKPNRQATTAWPQEAMVGMYGCKRFFALLTSSYFRSKSCIDEFLTALCYQKEYPDLNLISLYMETITNMPQIIRNIPFTDCRLSRGENLSDKFSCLCKTAVEKLPITKLRVEPCRENDRRSYDIFISYSELEWKTAEVVYKIMKRHNPNLNIFYDRMGIHGNYNWSHTVYKALNEVRCCVILLENGYLYSAMNKEEFNIVVSRRLFEKQKKEIAVIPICMSNLEFIPDWLGSIYTLNGRGKQLQATVEMVSSKIHMSFKHNTIQKDFDWLMEKELKKDKNCSEVITCHRDRLFDGRFFVHEAMVIPFLQPGPIDIPLNIVICFSKYDRRIAGMLADILMKEIDWMNIIFLDKPRHDWLDILRKADYIVMFVCEDYLSSDWGLEVLSICLDRQRQSFHRIIHFACTSVIPDCLSLLQILPYSFVLGDPIWSYIRRRSPEEGIMQLTLKGAKGTFLCERFEHMALEKLTIDIMTSEYLKDNLTVRLENCLSILKMIQEKENSYEMTDILAPCPHDFQKSICLQENLIESEHSDSVRRIDFMQG